MFKESVSNSTYMAHKPNQQCDEIVPHMPNLQLIDVYPISIYKFWIHNHNYF